MLDKDEQNKEQANVKIIEVECAGDKDPSVYFKVGNATVAWGRGEPDLEAIRKWITQFTKMDNIRVVLKGEQ